MRNSDTPFPRQPPDRFQERNAFLDCLLGVIGLCERTLGAIADEVEPAGPDEAPAPAPAPVGPILR
jgi:hypothetical protein